MKWSTFSPPQWSSFTPPLTRMQGPGSTRLNYSLLRDPARANNWGNTIATDTVAGMGTGSTQSLTVYGRLPGNQTALRQGTYSDMITATITF